MFKHSCNRLSRDQQGDAGIPTISLMNVRSHARDPSMTSAVRWVPADQNGGGVGSLDRQVFISYQRFDRCLAHRSATISSRQESQTWIDRYDIPVRGTRPTRSTRDRWHRHRGWCPLPQRGREPQRQEQWDWAIANERPLILIQIAPCVIPHRYVSINYIDATRDPDSALSSHGRSLAGRIDRHAAVRSTSVPVHTRSTSSRHTS